MNDHGETPSPSPKSGRITVRALGSGSIDLTGNLAAPPDGWALRPYRGARALPVPHRPSSGASLQDPDRSPRHPQLGNSGIVSFRGQAWDSRHPATSLSFALESILGYIRERLGHSLYIADLSRAAGLSERSIHTLFRKELGMSPMQYIKSERLLMAKRMLQDNAAGHISVKVAAISAGFRDLGRFSIEYHSMFGEAPSQTLRRCHPPQANTAAILANQVPPASPPAGSVNLR